MKGTRVCLAARDQIQSIAARSTNSSETHCSGCKGSLEIYLGAFSDPTVVTNCPVLCDSAATAHKNAETTTSAAHRVIDSTTFSYPSPPVLGTFTAT